MQQKIQITLPVETVGLIDRIVSRTKRSRFIDAAVKHYVAAIGSANLRKQLKEGAIARAERDLGLAEEWFPVEEEAWQK